MALATRLRRQDAHRRHAPHTQRRILELGNIPQLLHDRLLSVNCVRTVSRPLAPVSNTIIGGCKNLPSPNNNGNVKKGIMPSRVLAAILGRVGVDGPLQKSRRHCKRIQLKRRKGASWNGRGAVSIFLVLCRNPKKVEKGLLGVSSSRMHTIEHTRYIHQVYHN